MIRAIVILLLSSVAYAQTNVVGPQLAAYTLSGSSWIPQTSTLDLFSIDNAPAVELYCLNTDTQKWVPWTSECGGGGGGVPSGAAGGDLGGTYPDPTVTGAHITTGTINGATVGATTPSTVRGTTITASTQVVSPIGSAATPAYGFTGISGSGLFFASGVSVTVGGTQVNQMSTGAFRILPTQVFGMTSGVPAATAIDTSLSRASAGVWNCGTAETGNGKCTFNLGILQGGSAIPVVTNGTGTVAINTGSTNVAGTLTSSTAGAISFTLTWGDAKAYAHRAVCQFTDETTGADTVKTSSATTTTLIAGGTTASGDVISYSCSGF